MKAVIRAESMEQVAYLISSILRDVPFPANLILSAGAGATVSGLLDKALARFADGGIVGGANPAQGDVIPALLTSGELILNKAQQDNVAQGMGGNIPVNVSAPLVDETVIDTIIPAIQKVQQGNLA